MSTLPEWLKGLLWGVGIFCIIIVIMSIGYGIGKNQTEEDIEKSKIIKTKVIEQCNRINLLSCIACHDFPAYVIDIEPEVWEDE